MIGKDGRFLMKPGMKTPPNDPQEMTCAEAARIDGVADPPRSPGAGHLASRLSRPDPGRLRGESGGPDRSGHRPRPRRRKTLGCAGWASIASPA